MLTQEATMHTLPIGLKFTRLLVLMIPLLPSLACAITADEALQQVKNVPCKDNQSIEQILDQSVKSHYQRDIGWRQFQQDDYFDIERAVLINKGREMRYRWRVDLTGAIKPENERAEKLCLPS